MNGWLKRCLPSPGTKSCQDTNHRFTNRSLMQVGHWRRDRSVAMHRAIAKKLTEWSVSTVPPTNEYPIRSPAAGCLRRRSDKIDSADYRGTTKFYKNIAASNSEKTEVSKNILPTKTRGLCVCLTRWRIYTSETNRGIANLV